MTVRLAITVTYAYLPWGELQNLEDVISRGDRDFLGLTRNPITIQYQTSLRATPVRDRERSLHKFRDTAKCFCLHLSTQLQKPISPRIQRLRRITSERVVVCAAPTTSWDCPAAPFQPSSFFPVHDTVLSLTTESTSIAVDSMSTEVSLAHPRHVAGPSRTPDLCSHEAPLVGLSARLKAQ